MNNKQYDNEAICALIRDEMLADLVPADIAWGAYRVSSFDPEMFELMSQYMLNKPDSLRRITALLNYSTHRAHNNA